MMDALPLSSCILILYIPDKVPPWCIWVQSSRSSEPAPRLSLSPLSRNVHCRQILVALADGRIFDEVPEIGVAFRKLRADFIILGTKSISEVHSA